MSKVRFNKAVSEFIEAADEQACRILDEFRDILVASTPGVREVFEDGQPVYLRNGPVCRVSVVGRYVNYDAIEPLSEELDLEFRWAGYVVRGSVVGIRFGQHIPVYLLRELVDVTVARNDLRAG